MNTAQPGILSAVPRHARYLTFACQEIGAAHDAVHALPDVVDGERTVIGVGHSLVRALGGSVAGLRAFPAITGPALEIPSTPAALWIWAKGDDRGKLLHRSRAIERSFAAAFRVESVVDAFVYDGGRDL
jgi:putative iron-dependent peroxidase